MRIIEFNRLLSNPVAAIKASFISTNNKKIGVQSRQSALP
jgi:hypothetical protein